MYNKYYLLHKCVQFLTCFTAIVGSDSQFSRGKYHGKKQQDAETVFRYFLLLSAKEKGYR